MRPDGSLRLIQHKSGRLVTVSLRSSTLAALDAIKLPMPLEWSITRGQFDKNFKKIVARSGVNRGTFRWLRRSSGSYVESIMPGAGHRHLGHADASTFRRHYDAQIGGSTLPLPPEL